MDVYYVDYWVDCLTDLVHEHIGKVFVKALTTHANFGNQHALQRARILDYPELRESPARRVEDRRAL